jgi:predicted N-acetyltransferase YhbS
MFNIIAERPEDAAPRQTLLDLVFGDDRNLKTVYRLRDGIDPVAGLCQVALDGEKFQGSLRFWPVSITGAKSPLLLGPLAVDPARRGQAIGIALVRRGLRDAAALGHDLVLVVGEPSYYARFGFEAAAPHGLTLPGPVDETRFQVVFLSDTVGASGVVSKADCLCR